MKRSVRKRSVGAFLTMAALLFVWGCPAGTMRSDAPHMLPDRDRSVKSVPKEPTVDNQRCFVCHANYQEEPLVLFHAGGGVGCEQCHGESLAHTNDEDNVTAPEIMYSRENLNAACLTCHAAFKFVREPQPIPGVSKGKVVCTDCHFKHRLERRNRVWDKVSGKLLSEPPVNPMTSDPK